MHTLVAFWASMTNGVVLQPVAGVSDQSITIDTGGRARVPWPGKLIAAAAFGINLSRAQINCPSFRNPMLPEIYPAIAAAAPPATNQPMIQKEYGPNFISGDFFIPNISRAGADAQPVTVLTWITQSFTPAPAGKVYTLVGTVTATMIAGAWVLANPVWDQTLPPGKYHVIGMAGMANDAGAMRLVYPGGAQYRPGVPVQPTYSSLICGDPFRMGRFGHFGTFDFDAMPQIETLGLVAGAEPLTVFLDLVKA